MGNSTLYCVGCGPGDPDLLTLKAINIIKNAEIRQLVFPMVKDYEKLREHWKTNAKEIADAVRNGKKAVYLTVGDPSLYSTWIYIHKEMSNTYKDIEIEIVPGITSIFSFSAEIKTPIGEGEEIIGIIPACYNLDRLKIAAECCDTLVFLKDGRYFNNVIDILMESSFPEDSDIFIAEDVSTDNETLQKRKLVDVAKNKNENNDKYFS